MDTSTREVFRKILQKKQDEVRHRVMEWDKQTLRRKERMEIKEKVYLVFGEFNGEKLPTSLYIGKTRQELDKRFAQHMREVKQRLEGYKNWSIKYRWMWEMIDRGQEVRIILLNKVQKSKVYEVEKEWVYYLGLHNFNMINKANFMYYQKKVFTI